LKPVVAECEVANQRVADLNGQVQELQLQVERQQQKSDCQESQKSNEIAKLSGELNRVRELVSVEKQTSNRFRRRMQELEQTQSTLETAHTGEVTLLKEKLNHLDQQFRREASGRRKAESALRLEAARPNSQPQLQAAQSLMDLERSVERLTSELAATKNQGLKVRQLAARKIKLAAKKIQQLQLELKSRPPTRAAG